MLYFELKFTFVAYLLLSNSHKLLTKISLSLCKKNTNIPTVKTLLHVDYLYLFVFLHLEKYK